jgi:hypothetical protein
MELTAVSFVVILFGTAWCWKDKPSDVGTTITLHSSNSIETILMMVNNDLSQELQKLC